MLADHDRDRRQLGDLMAPEAPARPALELAELAPAPPTPVREVIDDLIDPILSHQLAARARMPLLAAGLSLSTLLAQQLFGLRARLRASLLTGLGRI
jgi:hypothetical protein